MAITLFDVMVQPKKQKTTTKKTFSQIQASGKVVKSPSIANFLLHNAILWLHSTKFDLQFQRICILSNTGLCISSWPWNNMFVPLPIMQTFFSLPASSKNRDANDWNCSKPEVCPWAEEATVAVLSSLWLCSLAVPALKQKNVQVSV